MVDMIFTRNDFDFTRSSTGHIVGGYSSYTGYRVMNSTYYDGQIILDDVNVTTGGDFGLDSVKKFQFMNLILNGST